MSWTNERIELLKKLWADGLSATQIAVELGGVTRNAVIGKVHRLGLSGRAKSPSSSSPRPRKARSSNAMISRDKITAAVYGEVVLTEKDYVVPASAYNYRNRYGKSPHISSKERYERGIVDENDSMHMPAPSEELSLDAIRYLEKHLYT